MGARTELAGHARGSRYAFASPDSIYVENVASGTLSEIGQGHAWNIVSVQAPGVYATQPNNAELWFVPFTGDLLQVTAGGFWPAATAEAAYGTPTSAVPQGAANTIVRVDLKTGATSTWFTRQGAQSTVIGFDILGRATISVNDFSNAGISEVWISTQAGSAAPITGSGNGMSVYGPPVADSHGVWFTGSYSDGYSSVSGLALYVPGSGIYWMSNLGGLLAGGCLQP